MEENFLPQIAHRVEEADIDAVVRVLRSDRLTSGPVVAEFERALAARVGAKYAVACANGTAALHLACLALGLAEGQRALVPSVTFLATANCARYVGAEVTFADVDPENGLLTVEALKAALAAPGVGGAARVVLPVHLGGQCADPAAIAEFAREHGLKVVEDACHALGTTYLDEHGARTRVGACQHSDMAVFSFHAVKTVAMGEGGAVTTNDPALSEALRCLRNHGMSQRPATFPNADPPLDEAGGATPWYYEMTQPGFNYRVSDIHCALGLSQLKRLDRIAAERAALAACYDEALAPLAPAVRPVSRVSGCDPVWHLYTVLVDFAAFGMDRAAFMSRLRESGIGTQLHYIPVHLQPYYRQRYGARSLPGAESYYAHALSLPFFTGMEQDQVARVVRAIGDLRK